MILSIKIYLNYKNKKTMRKQSKRRTPRIPCLSTLIMSPGDTPKNSAIRTSMKYERIV